MYRLREIAEVTGGTLYVSDEAQGLARPAGVSFDTRGLRPGDLFIAIRGIARDGHDFVEDAFRRGASAAVVSEDWFVRNPQFRTGAFIRVANPVGALQVLAAHYRRSLKARVVAITGSNGKTTTKDMAASVLARRFRTAKTEGNLNNHLGVPLTLLRIPEDSEAAVVEMGMNHPGEIRRLAEISRPGVGVVTNVGPSHLEFLGSVENVLAAKGELLEYLKPADTAVLNADDPYLTSGRLSIRARTLTFGIDAASDFRPDRVEAVAGEGALFVLEGREVRLGVPGREFVYDALAAVAVGSALGVSLDDACGALEGFRPLGMRMETVRMGKVTVINDAYNANPTSVRAALRTLARMGKGGRTVAVLGDMLELGEHASRLHFEVGEAVAASGVDLLFTVGTHAREIQCGALSGGMPENRARHSHGSEEVREALRRTITDGDWVLVKGSRGCRMETIADDLVSFLGGKN